MTTHDRLIVMFLDGIAIGLYLALFAWSAIQLVDGRRARKRRKAEQQPTKLVLEHDRLVSAIHYVLRESRGVAPDDPLIDLVGLIRETLTDALGEKERA